MNIFQQMLYYVRDIQQIDIFQQYNSKKINCIPFFIVKNKELIFFHPFNKFLTNEKNFVERYVKTTFDVTHHYVFILNIENLTFNYKVNNDNNSYDKIVKLVEAREVRNATNLNLAIKKDFYYAEKVIIKNNEDTTEVILPLIFSDTYNITLHDQNIEFTIPEMIDTAEEFLKFFIHALYYYETEHFKKINAFVKQLIEEKKINSPTLHDIINKYLKDICNFYEKDNNTNESFYKTAFQRLLKLNNNKIKKLDIDILKYVYGQYMGSNELGTDDEPDFENIMENYEWEKLASLES